MKTWLSLFLVIANFGMAATSYADDRGEYLITDFGAKGDNGFDNAPVINDIIAKFGANGGTIVIPEGDFRINSPIVINKNYVTIRGVSYGERSNVDAPPGVFGPAGGSKLILGAGVQFGIAVYDNGAKLLGLTVKDMAFAGSDWGVYQHGIFIDHTNQWTRIENVNCVNLHKGVYIKQAEEAQISNSWFAECESPLHMNTGKDCIVADNSLGGQPPGVTADFHAQERLIFTGNCVFPDSFALLWLTEASNCNVNNNTITTWHTGGVQVEGSMNSLSHNNITAVQNNGGWPADPKGRDGLYGLVRISGNDNAFDSNTIFSWQPDGDTRVHIASGDRNTVRNLTIGGLGSSKKIFVNGDLTTWTRITHCGWDTEIDLSGSPTARVEYDP